MPRAGQPRAWSLAESIANVAIGFGVALAVQAIVFPWFGVRLPASDNVAIALVFTVVSVVRSYFVRRFFDWVHAG